MKPASIYEPSITGIFMHDWSTAGKFEPTTEILVQAVRKVVRGDALILRNTSNGVSSYMIGCRTMGRPEDNFVLTYHQAVSSPLECWFREKWTLGYRLTLWHVDWDASWESKASRMANDQLADYYGIVSTNLEKFCLALDHEVMAS